MKVGEILSYQSNKGTKAVFLIRKWLEKLQLSHWTVSTNRISMFQVSDEFCNVGHQFVGVSMDEVPNSATIHHTRDLTEEDIVHELLHVRYPEWSEDDVNLNTHILLKQKEKSNEIL